MSKKVDNKSKYKKSIQRHVVTCPHCGRDVLDHMTQCPFCKGELTPKYYTPTRSADETKALKRTLSIVGFVIAAAIVIAILIIRNT